MAPNPAVARYVNSRNNNDPNRPKGGNVPASVKAMWNEIDHWRDMLKKMPIEHYVNVLALVTSPLSDAMLRRVPDAARSTLCPPHVNAVTAAQVFHCIDRIALDGRGTFMIASVPAYKFICGLDAEHGWFLHDITKGIYVVEKRTRDEIEELIRAGDPLEVPET